MDTLIPKEVKVLESIEDIKNLRTHILKRYSEFKKKMSLKKEKLEDSKKFQYFKRDAHEFKLWILEKTQVASSNGNDKNSTDSQDSAVHKHRVIEAEVCAHNNVIVILGSAGIEMINQKHYASAEIYQIIKQLYDDWDLLLKKLFEMSISVNVELVTTDECSTDTDRVLPRIIDAIPKDAISQENRVTEVDVSDSELDLNDHSEKETLLKFKKDLHESKARLDQMSQERLFDGDEVQRFNRNAEKINAWISEKDEILSTKDESKDLAGVQTLQRRHKGVERDLVAIGNAVSIFGQEAYRLCEIHSDESLQIKVKRGEIIAGWKRLTAKVQERRQKLHESYLLHSTLGNFHDLTAWIKDMKEIIYSNNLTKDMADIEALLEIHYGHIKAEIDSREINFHCALESVKNILKSENVPPSVNDGLNNLINEKNELLTLWEEKRILYEQNLDLQLFYRDAKQINKWMAQQEAFLLNEDIGDSIDNVEELLGKHENFEKSLAARGEEIKCLQEFSIKLTEGRHCAAENISKYSETIFERRSKLLKKSADRRKVLENSYKFMQFEYNCVETKEWINEKLKVANDDNYLDLTNLYGKVQKHTIFEQILIANKSQIDDVCSTGLELIESKHYTSNTEERIQLIISEIVNLWEKLLNASKKKGSKLREAKQQQQFNSDVECIDLWLSEIEAKQPNEYYGIDLIDVENLQRKHTFLEVDFFSHQDHIENIKKTADQLVSSGHFDADNIRAKQVELCKRYYTLEKLIKIHKQQLTISQTLFHDIEIEEIWINQKKRIIKSKNIGRDLISLRNLIRNHQATVTEINNHESRITSVIQACENIVHVSLAKQRLENHWERLKENALQRKQELVNYLEAYQYFIDVNEAECWIKEKESIILSQLNQLNQNYEQDKIYFEALLKRHEILLSELETFKTIFRTLTKQVAACKQRQIPVIDVYGNEWVQALNSYTGNSPKDISFKRGDILILLNSSHKKFWKVEINGRRGFISNQYMVRPKVSNLSESQQLLVTGGCIAEKQAQMEIKFSKLLKLIKKHQIKLEEVFNRVY